MRLRFIKGKQKELIHIFRTENNLSWKELCKLLNIKYGRLKSYFDETSFMEKGLYKKLDIKGRYNKYLLEELDDNWGRRKGGVISPGRTKKINLPPDSENLAEFYGIMLGDGNSHKNSHYASREDKRGVYSIRIVGDSTLDKSYLEKHVKSLIEELFDLRVKIGRFKPRGNSRNAMFLESHGRELVAFLERKGFIPGNKIKNNLGIPFWIKDNKNYLISCLRGLYDTDGSIYKITNQNSYQICFTNYNLNLLQDVRNSLLKLGINCSRISNHDIYITRKSELRKFLKLLGFSNDRHLNKVKKWKLDIAL